MVCLDGSKGSINALRTAILFARQSNATIVGVHSDVSKGSRRSFSAPKIKEERWSKEVKKIMQYAKDKCKIRRTEFEGVVIAGYNTGNDLASFANNKKTRSSRLLSDLRERDIQKEHFLEVSQTLYYTRQRYPLQL